MQIPQQVVVRYDTVVRFSRIPVVLSVAFLSGACLLTHELAHAFAAICCGGGIQNWVLLSVTPHVSVSGVFTIAQNTWICAAGSASELLLFFVALVAAPRTVGGRLAIEVTGTFAAIELVGWTVSALAYPYGPRNSDVWKFLTSSGYHPMLVFATCLLTAAGFLFAYRVRVLRRF
jgi:hypothetical protein